MLTLRAAQLDAFEHAGALGFLRRLTDRLSDGDNTVLKDLPGFVRTQMVANGVATAAAHGFTLERTLGGFVALQCETAADFHRHPLAHQILLAGEPEERRFERLLQDIPATVWTTIRGGADLAAWFQPATPSQLATRVAASVCAVFPEFARHAADAALRRFFAAAVARAGQHGMTAPEDAAVYAAALALYGDRLDKAHGPTWAAGVFGGAPLPAERKVALLRLRLLLDTDRLI